MKIKTSELTGAALDWAVAKCEGYTNLRPNPHAFDRALIMTPPRKEYGPVYLCDLNYSSAWAQGGPIIERELIEIGFDGTEWYANKYDRTDPVGETYLCGGEGPTPLIAAMRCRVASKLGDEVDVPKELT